ncbi:hypothetical protein [Actinocrispum sp. NPDC049592]|uniref:hypothetical protein n=1 Tax=Actinocrispum sp. NPDC049592 TaxID=3154835 RepID=UPI003413A25E
MECSDASVAVDVTDSGVPGSAGVPGHGLTGIAERAALYGGHASAGPVPAGWRVHAVLPLEVR